MHTQSACEIAMLKARFYRQLGFDVLSCHAINNEPHVEVRPSKSFDPLVKLAMQLTHYDTKEITWTPKRHH